MPTSVHRSRHIVLRPKRHQSFHGKLRHCHHHARLHSSAGPAAAPKLRLHCLLVGCVAWLCLRAHGHTYTSQLVTPLPQMAEMLRPKSGRQRTRDKEHCACRVAREPPYSHLSIAVMLHTNLHRQYPPTHTTNHKDSVCVCQHV